MALADFTIEVFAQLVLDELVTLMAPFRQLSTVFDTIEDTGDKVKVPVVSGVALNAVKTKVTRQDYDPGPTLEPTTVELELTNEAYVGMDLPRELATKASRTPEAMQRLAARQARALALHVYTNFFAEFSAANFPTPVYSGSGAAYGYDDLVAAWKAKTKAWGGAAEASLLLSTDIWGALLLEEKLTNVNDSIREGVLQRAAIPGMVNFGLAHGELIPDNGEQLAGLMLTSDAVAFAMTNVPAAGEVGTGGLVELQDFTHEETGLTMTYRQIYTGSNDVRMDIFETQWGSEILDSNRCRRIVDTDI